MLDKKISKSMMRTMNETLILRKIKDKGYTYKATLSKETGLTLPSVAEILSNLEKKGLIKNSGETKTTRGRFPSRYQLNAEGFKVIGILVGSRKIKGGVIHLDGSISSIVKKNLPPLPTPENVMKLMIEVIQEVIASQSDLSAIYGIGIGMHGVVDPVKGLSIFPPHLKWKNTPIRDYIESKFNLPVLIDNDCNVATLAENWFGQGENNLSFITLYIDYGVGSGVLLDGNLFRGSSYGAGQIGHNSVMEDGPLCTCGNYGCLEAIASENSILSQLVKKLKVGFPSVLSTVVKNLDDLTINDVYDAAIQNDPLALDAIVTAARYIGVGVASLLNIFNPEKIIILGGILKVKDLISEPIFQSVSKHALQSNIQNLEIVFSELGENIDILGAGTLWINELLNGRVALER